MWKSDVKLLRRTGFKQIKSNNYTSINFGVYLQCLKTLLVLQNNVSKLL